MLLLLAIGDCIANNRSQEEMAKKYGIPKSRIQRAMSGKKEHKRCGKQYRQEKKQKLSEEDQGVDKRARKDQHKMEIPLEGMPLQEQMKRRMRKVNPAVMNCQT